MEYRSPLLPLPVASIFFRTVTLPPPLHDCHIMMVYDGNCSLFCWPLLPTLSYNAVACLLPLPPPPPLSDLFTMPSAALSCRCTQAGGIAVVVIAVTGYMWWQWRSTVVTAKPAEVEEEEPEPGSAVAGGAAAP